MAVGLEHWTVGWEALVVPVGVGRLDNTKNVREGEQIYFGSSDRNWIHDKGTRMIIYTLTSG